MPREVLPFVAPSRLAGQGRKVHSPWSLPVSRCCVPQSALDLPMALQESLDAAQVSVPEEAPGPEPMGKQMVKVPRRMLALLVRAILMLQVR